MVPSWNDIRIASSALLMCVYLLIPWLAGCSSTDPQYSTRSPEALAAYEEGVVQWRLFHYVEARAFFEQAIQYDSAFALARARLAILDFNAQNEASAREEIARALALAESATRRERLFIKMWERRINFARDEAEVVVDSFITLYPRDPEPYLFRGMLLEEKKRFDEAIRMYRRALEVDSTFAPAVMTLGYAYSNLNDQERGLAYMERYIRLVPTAADPRASYGDLLFRAGRYDDALEQYQRALDFKPDYWYAFQQIGSINAALGRLNAAEEFITKAIHLLPPSSSMEASSISTRAGLHVQRGRYYEALVLYEKAMETDSTNLNAVYGYVYALTTLGRFSDAENVLDRFKVELERRGLDESPAMVGLHLSRSRLLMEEGAYDSALRESDAAFEYSTPLARPQIHRQRAEILMRLRLYEDALMACEEALNVNPNSPQILLTLTRVYAAKGDVRMTQTIGNRLAELWGAADMDFQDAIELKKILSRRKPPGT